MQQYYEIEKGRSIKAILLGGFVLFLSVGFSIAGIEGSFYQGFTWDSTILLGIGIFLFGLFISCLYAFIKGEKWEISISNSILSWSYPRWPKSNGSIELKNIAKVTIRNDSFSNLKIDFNNGDTKKIKLIGNNYKLKKFFEENYNDIEIEFIDGSS
jgi:hypothetical protein